MAEIWKKNFVCHLLSFFISLFFIHFVFVSYFFLLFVEEFFCQLKVDYERRKELAERQYLFRHTNHIIPFLLCSIPHNDISSHPTSNVFEWKWCDLRCATNLILLVYFFSSVELNAQFFFSLIQHSSKWRAKKKTTTQLWKKRKKNKSQRK